MNELDIRAEDFVPVPAYGTSKEMTEFWNRLGGTRPRIVSGNVEYYSFEHYGMLLAGISSLNDAECVDNGVVAELEELLNSQTIDIIPPSCINLSKQEKGIVLTFKDGKPHRFVSGGLYKTALRVFNDLRLGEKLKEVPGKDPFEEYFELLYDEKQDDGAPQTDDSFSGSDIKYDRIIDAVSYLIKEYVFDRWAEDFNRQRARKIKKKVEGDLRKRFLSYTKGTGATQAELTMYIQGYFDSKYSEEITKHADPESIDKFFIKRSQSSQPVAIVYGIISDITPTNVEKGKIIREFFNVFFDYIRQNTSAFHYITESKEIEALGNNKEVQDFFECIYHITNDMIRLTLSKEHLSRAVQEPDYMPLSRLDGKDMMMIMKGVRKRAEMVRSHDKH